MDTLAITLTPEDTRRLRRAIALLEHQSYAMSVAASIGVPIETLLRLLPSAIQSNIGTIVDKALQQCLNIALAFNSNTQPATPNTRLHTLLTAATGATGGFFGLPGLAFELPVTTTVMLYSIAQIARHHGEDLSRPDAALACLEVLALGPDGRRTDVVESAYYATRAALAHVTRDAVAYLAQKGAVREGAPVLLSFLSKVAARFGLEVTEKAAAQLIPVAGAAGGLALNVLFTQHFQQIAEGHFTIRALERKYSPTLIHHEYTRLQTSGR